MTQPSALYQLVESKLDGTLADWVAANKGSVGWKPLASKLSAEVGVTVSAETLRLWFADRIQTRTTVVVVADPAGAA